MTELTLPVEAIAAALPLASWHGLITDTYSEHYCSYLVWSSGFSPFVENRLFEGTGQLPL